MRRHCYFQGSCPVASLGEKERGDCPGWHHPERWHPTEINFYCGWM